MCFLAYQENIKVNTFDGESVIEMLQVMESHCKQCQKRKIQYSKMPNYKFKVDKVSKEALCDNGHLLYQRMENGNRSIPNKPQEEFRSMRMKRADVRYRKPTKDFLGGYTPEETSASAFQQYMYHYAAYDCLAPLWQLRRHMSTSLLGNWKEFGTFLLQKEEGKRWINYLMAGYAVAHYWAKNGTTRYKNPTIVGDALEPIVPFLLKQQLQLTGTIHFKYVSLLMPMMFGLLVQA